MGGVCIFHRSRKEVLMDLLILCVLLKFLRTKRFKILIKFDL